jgi:hypothetical protein
MSENTLDPTRCPLCGVQNECGMAAGQAECWCFSVVVAQQTLERLPQAARGVSCVCKNCAAKDAEVVAAQASEERRG